MPRLVWAGVVGSLVCEGEGNVLSGHHRWLARLQVLPAALDEVVQLAGQRLAGLLRTGRDLQQDDQVVRVEVLIEQQQRPVDP